MDIDVSLKSAALADPVLFEMVARALLEAVILANCGHLIVFPDTPELYKSGVRYARFRGQKERFVGIPQILARGKADCDQLCAYRAAELRVREGIDAKFRITLTQKSDALTVMHCVLRLPDGTIEDPSRRLGME